MLGLNGLKTILTYRNMANSLAYARTVFLIYNLTFNGNIFHEQN